MARPGAALACAGAMLLLMCGAVCAARMPSKLVAELASEAFPSGLRNVRTGMPFRLDKKGKSYEDERAYVVMRFTVPPSEAEEFEKEWIKMEEKAWDAHGKRLRKFDLQKTKMDNLYYMSYSEWTDHHEFMDHLHTDHFNDFADHVDDAGIKWEMHVLEDYSTDVEEHSKSLGRGGKGKSKNYANVMIHYTVPPGEADKFVDVWTNTAFDTVEKEKGNIRYNLRRHMFDNTRFYVWGTWESAKDYFDHLESNHMRKLMDFTDDHDITWFIIPMHTIESSRKGNDESA